MFTCVKLRCLIFELLERTFKMNPYLILEIYDSRARIITVQCKVRRWWC